MSSSVGSSNQRHKQKDGNRREEPGSLPALFILGLFTAVRLVDSNLEGIL
jgi:hypothetical protein